MLNWISNAAADIAGWVGSGIASVIEWLLGGIADLFTLIFDAANGLWDVLESIWNLSVGLVDALLKAFYLVFPFVPEPVANVISAGLIVVVIAGFVKKVRGN